MKKTFVAEFGLTYDVMRTTSRLHARLHGRKQQIVIYSVGLAFAAMGIILFAVSRSSYAIGLLGALCEVIGAYVLTFPVRSIKKAWKTYAKNPFTIKYAFKKDSFEVKVADSVATNYYSDITAIYRRKGTLYFYVGENKIHSLPLSAIYGGTADEFCGLLVEATDKQIDNF